MQAAEAMPATQKSESEGQPAESRQLLTFTLGNELYAIDIMQVREVKGWSETTRLPNSPEFLRGVLNLRGAIVPIYDLRMRLSGELTQPEETHVIIILNLKQRIIGILVDAVCDILTVTPEALKAPPNLDDGAADEAAANHQFVKSLIANGERMVVLLDLTSLSENTPDLENEQ